MNYTSQLKGWAVDRLIEFYKSNQDYNQKGRPVPRTLDNLLDDATKLVGFCYVLEEDINELRNRLADLEHNQETLNAIKMRPASNAQGNA